MAIRTTEQLPYHCSRGCIGVDMQVVMDTCNLAATNRATRPSHCSDQPNLLICGIIVCQAERSVHWW